LAEVYRKILLRGNSKPETILANATTPAKRMGPEGARLLSNSYSKDPYRALRVWPTLGADCRDKKGAKEKGGGGG